MFRSGDAIDNIGRPLFHYLRRGKDILPMLPVSGTRSSEDILTISHVEWILDSVCGGERGFHTNMLWSSSWNEELFEELLLVDTLSKRGTTETAYLVAFLMNNNISLNSHKFVSIWAKRTKWISSISKSSSPQRANAQNGNQIYRSLTNK